MAEWFKAPVLKTGIPQGIEGSNPSLSVGFDDSAAKAAELERHKLLYAASGFERRSDVLVCVGQVRKAKTASPDCRKIPSGILPEGESLPPGNFCYANGKDEELKPPKIPMSNKLIFLGTGNALVTRCYNTCFALQNGNEYFLTDAGGGNGILAQLEKAQIPLVNIHSLFLTHGHTDHILGVVWLIRLAASLFVRGKHTGLTIYCHEECEKKLRLFCQMTLTLKLQSVLDNGIKFICLQDGESFHAAGLACTSFDIHSTKTKQFGYRAVLPDGQTVVCLGDEPYNPACQRYAQNADWLLTEAFCLYAERNEFNPYEKHHSTALDAARNARALNAKHLILYHTQDNCLAQRKRLYTAEAKRIFPGPVLVPDDLETIIL